MLETVIYVLTNTCIKQSDQNDAVLALDRKGKAAKRNRTPNEKRAHSLVFHPHNGHIQKLRSKTKAKDW